MFAIPTSISGIKVPVILSNMSTFIKLCFRYYHFFSISHFSCQNTEPSYDVTFCVFCSISQYKC